MCATPRRRDALVAAIAEGVRRHRHPGQQRRHHARQPGAAHEGRGLGRGDGDQPEAGVPAVARGDARHDEGALGPDHQHHLGGRRLRQSRAGQLRRRQGRRRRHGEVARARTRQPQHHGELRRAGIHRHRHDARAARGAEERAAGADPARPPRPAGGRRRRGRLSRLARGRPTSPARCCTSTAACTCPDSGKIRASQRVVWPTQGRSTAWKTSNNASRKSSPSSSA